MAMIRDMASFSIKELGLYKVEPVTPLDWQVIDRYLLEKAGENK